MNAPQAKQKKPKTAVTPTRAEDYAQWYQQVVRAADMAEMSGVRGCMVIKPWGYGIWENMQRDLDRRFKETGHENCYFPIFIPLSYIQKEAGHVEGFAKEMAVVTHHRLVMKDGVLTPDAPLEEPMVVRPTSETVIGEAFAKWVQSYRDLPVLINQWANVVRWEMRPRIFLRTVEFLWQEGHTAHEDYDDAMRETKQMLEVYRAFVEEMCAVPVIAGEKIEQERFPGAVSTLSIEAMMQDGRALQAGTSHYLGQNFAKAAGIQYQTREGGLEFAHTTSWGMSTRMVGALIMTHADDDGMRVPPRLAPQQIVIVPVTRGGDDNAKVMTYINKVAEGLRATGYGGQPLRVRVDTRDMPGAEKRWEWIKKGVPLLLEVGMRDIEGGKVCVTRRDNLAGGKRFDPADIFVAGAAKELAEIQKGMFDVALAYQKARTTTDVLTLADFEAYFGKDADSSFTGGQGFVRAKWSGDAASLAYAEKHGVTVRCIPFDQDGKVGKCVLTGKPATQDVIFGRAY
ncbi:MAG: proline--tRNA ligase [Alphaproteobacteria bacterium]|nr:proline--tRNA ligase [Alphaproteobacteria bacterium]